MLDTALTCVQEDPFDVETIRGARFVISDIRAALEVRLYLLGYIFRDYARSLFTYRIWKLQNNCQILTRTWRTQKFDMAESLRLVLEPFTHLHTRRQTGPLHGTQVCR